VISIPEAQFRAYRDVVLGMTGRTVTIRTLDVGADKADRTGLALADEQNPALGVRGVRLSLLRRTMTPHGTLVLVGGEHGGGRVLGGFDRQLLRAPLVSMFAGQRLRGLTAKEGAADLEAITRLIDSGAVTPVIDRTYALADAPDAIRYLAEGHAAGKVVVTV
jgi:hypothetical protein